MKQVEIPEGYTLETAVVPMRARLDALGETMEMAFSMPTPGESGEATKTVAFKPTTDELIALNEGAVVVATWGASPESPLVHLAVVEPDANPSGQVPPGQLELKLDLKV